MAIKRLEEAEARNAAAVRALAEARQKAESGGSALASPSTMSSVSDIKGYDIDSSERDEKTRALKEKIASALDRARALKTDQASLPGSPREDGVPLLESGHHEDVDERVHEAKLRI